MLKLIDLKAELATAQDNVQMYAFIKEKIIEAANAHPNSNVEFLINEGCRLNNYPRETFDFVLECDRQLSYDMLSKFKRPNK